MTSKGRVAKKYQPFIRAAKAGGGRVVVGSKHMKVYDGDELVTVLPFGTQQFEGPGDLATLRKQWRERGWLLK